MRENILYKNKIQGRSVTFEFDTENKINTTNVKYVALKVEIFEGIITKIYIMATPIYRDFSLKQKIDNN